MRRTSVHSESSVSSSDERFFTPRSQVPSSRSASSDPSEYSTPRTFREGAQISNRGHSLFPPSSENEMFATPPMMMPIAEGDFDQEKDLYHQGKMMKQNPQQRIDSANYFHEGPPLKHSKSLREFHSSQRDEYFSSQHVNLGNGMHQQYEYSNHNNHPQLHHNRPQPPYPLMREQRRYSDNMNLQHLREIKDIFSLARHNRHEPVEDLLSSGIPVNIRDPNGNTILSIACQNGNKRIMKLALRYGADINACNNRGNTPLHFCYKYGFSDILGAYLVSKGADTTIRNRDGRTCYEEGNQ